MRTQSRVDSMDVPCYTRSQLVSTLTANWQLGTYSNRKSWNDPPDVNSRWGHFVCVGGEKLGIR